MNDQPTRGTEPIAWHAAAARQQRHNIALIRGALGDVGDLDQPEQQFIAQIAWEGGHLELASLLRKARQAPPLAPAGQPTSDAPDTPAKEYLTHDGVVVRLGLQVWTNEARRGRITKIAVWPGDHGREDDVWHEVTYPDGRRVHLNRERITTRDVFGTS